jgi:hypothetical protein
MCFISFALAMHVMCLHIYFMCVFVDTVGKMTSFCQAPVKAYLVQVLHQILLLHVDIKAGRPR